MFFKEQLIKKKSKHWLSDMLEIELEIIKY